MVLDDEYFWPEYRHIKQYAFDVFGNTLNEKMQSMNLGHGDVFLLAQVYGSSKKKMVVKYQYDSEWSLWAIDKKYRDLYETPIQDGNDLWHANKALIKKTGELFNIMF